MILKRLILAGLLSAAAAPAHAAYEDLGAGARAGGMSQAFVAIADDVYTIYYNPAGLGVLERPTLGASYTLLSLGLKDGSSLNTSFVGYAHPIQEGRYGTLAAGWGAFSLNNSLYRDDSFYVSYGKLALGGAGWGDLYAGMSLKYLRSSFGSFAESTNGVGFAGLIGSGLHDPVLSGSRSRGAVDSDAGLLYRFGKHYSFGLDAMHLNRPNVSFSGSEAERLPLGVKAGFNYRSLISNLALQFDTKRGVAGRDNIVSIAAERWFPRLFVGDIAARGGMSLGTRGYKQFTLGGSYRSNRMQVDYAFVLPVASVNAEAGGHQASLSFRFGRASDNEETLEMVLDAMKQLKLGQPVVLQSAKAKDMSPTQKATLEEYLAQARALEARAEYKEALNQFTLALTVAPADKDLIERFGRLNFVGQQIKALPNYKSDPMQASLHLGITAYLGGDYAEAVAKVSEALALKPDYHELDGFLAQLEKVTGAKRSKLAKPAKDYGTAVLLTQASAAIEEKRYQDAIDLSLKVIRIDEYIAAAWENLGTSYFALKDYDSSYRAWQRAYQLEASPAVRAAIKGYLKSISRAREKRQPGRVSEVAPLPQRPSLPQEQIQKLFNEGIDHYTRREFEKAKEKFSEILQADPENVEAQKALRRVKDELP